MPGFRPPCLFGNLQTEQRYKELIELGVDVKMVAIGRKGQQYMKRRPKFNIVSKLKIIVT